MNKGNENQESKDQCNINSVSDSDKFRIKQTCVNEFVVEKNYNEKKTKGMLWWKETETVNRWIRVDKYGRKLFINQYINNIIDLVEFKTKDEAKEWIDNYRKYPIYHYC